MKTNVRALLRRKGTSVVTAPLSTTVYRCIQIMVDKNVGSILLIDDGNLAGIFTERDYLRRIVLEGRTSKTTIVREVMTTDVTVATPDTTVEECLTMMTTVRCRHLPVLADSRLLGLVSIGDCVKQLLHDAQAEAHSLQDFVRGRYPT
jgi:CBS domain-containing protein